MRTRLQAGKNHRIAARKVRQAGGRVARTLGHRRRIVDFYLACPKGYEVDHVYPVSKGGSHTLMNLQYLTKADNVRKSDTIPS